MRLLVSSILLNVFLFECIAFQNLELLKLIEIKHSYKSRLEKCRNCEQHQFSKKNILQFATFKHDHEFEYQGEVYDIKQVVIIDGEEYFLCIKDTEEKKQEEKLKEAGKNKSQTPNPFKKRMYLKTENKIPESQYRIVQCHYPPDEYNLSQCHLKKFAPPPELLT